MLAGRRPSPAIVVAVLAAIAALAGTAVAGPDVRSSAVTKKKVKRFVRKEVEKQLENVVIPPGEQGPPGPTTGASSATSAPAPGSGFSTDASVTITTPTAGRLWIEAVDGYRVNCAATPGPVHSIALFLDGSYVAGSRRDDALIESQTNAGSTSTFGIASNVSAGQHTVQLKRQLTASCGGSVADDAKIGAIALGR